MSAKDFILIARTIASLHPHIRHDVAVRFADNLQQTNPRFDRDRFIKAATTV